MLKNLKFIKSGFSIYVYKGIVAIMQALRPPAAAGTEGPILDRVLKQLWLLAKRRRRVITRKPNIEELD